MNRLVRSLSISLFVFVFVVLGARVSVAQEQWGFGPVLVFSARDGGGTAASFGVGEYRADRNQFGRLQNDSAYSVSVPVGYSVRFCEHEGPSGQGTGRCEDLIAGNNNLRYGGTASYIRVSRTSGGNGGGWNDGGQKGVVVYEDRDARGRSEDFGRGRYLNTSGELGRLRNDRASSVQVSPGFRVRLCDSEGFDGRGTGNCEEYGPGQFNLRYDNVASFIEVRRDSIWGGGGWGNGGGGGNDGGGGQGNNSNVVVFSDRNQRGRGQQFAVGIYRADAKQFGALANDSASSVSVPFNHRVRLCENEGTVGPKGRCEEYGPGTYDLRYDNTASFIEVKRGNDRWDDSDGGGWNGGGAPVIVYVDADRRGVSQEFREGTYRFVDRQFGRLPNDAASSVFVPPGYRVKFCENEGRGPRGERCEEMGPGTYNLAHNDLASSIFVTRN